MFFGIADSCADCPMLMFTVGGETSTRATGSGETVTSAVPVTPSLVAVIVAVPALMPVTSPDDDTVATWLLLLEKATGLPGST